MNEKSKIVIIGCGAGGGTAAQFARKTNKNVDIIVFEKGIHPQYSRCGIPYAVSGVIPKVEDLIEFSKEWFEKQKIKLYLETVVEKIDISKKIVTAKNNKKNIEVKFDKLIICTGSKPFIPKIEKIDVDNVFVVRTIDDVKKMKSKIKKGQNATIIGAGFIGLEMADNLNRMGLNVTIVETLSNILANNLDPDMSNIVFEKISKKVKIYTDHKVEKIKYNNGKIKKIIIKSKKDNKIKEIDTNFLIIAAGCKPNVKLAQDIGCKIGQTGGITVNNKSETNVTNVYAAGDCTEFVDFVSKKPVLIGLGSIAVRQAIAAGINAGDGDYVLPKGVLLTITSEFFGIEIGAVGYTSDKYKNILSGKFNGFSLPKYFPGGKPISVKVLANRNGKIMGAQVVGDNAAQRVNSFATAILGDLDIETFRKLETAYAPPIAPTLDAVTLACDIVSMKLARMR
ncbi:MAG: FAD-dependent oxidoreductase [Thermoplasmatales archaeon]|nr:MAG: FAD-dependent oxidoreductase [Thermoplasmatales archaeon]